MNELPLDLESPRWRELAQAFGSAEDVPRLLGALVTESGARERDELWFGVWATLCTDGTVFTAAYAAAPHLLLITEEQGVAERAMAVHVVTEVEIARHRLGAPAIPDDLVAAYAHAVESLPAVVASLATVPWNRPTALVLAAALLAGKRQPTMARAVLAMGEAEQ